MLKALLLGARGLLAKEIIASRPPGVDLTSRSRLELDVTKRANLEDAIGRHRPDWIINASAYSKVDQAEWDRDQAMLVNAEAPRLIGEVAHTLGARVLHVSTDYVFSGDGNRPYREDDIPCPHGVYAQSKREGERQLANSGARYLIARTQWLFGTGGPSFPRTMIQRARERQTTRVVDDQWGRPTSAADLAQALWLLMARDTSGIIHIANEGTATWYDVARYVFDALGAGDCLSPCKTTEFPRPAPRPKYSVLDTARFEAIRGAPLPRWQDALDQFVAAELMDSGRLR